MFRSEFLDLRGFGFESCCHLRNCRKHKIDQNTVDIFGGQWNYWKSTVLAVNSIYNRLYNITWYEIECTWRTILKFTDLEVWNRFSNQSCSSVDIMGILWETLKNSNYQQTDLDLKTEQHRHDESQDSSNRTMPIWTIQPNHDGTSPPTKTPEVAPSSAAEHHVSGSNWNAEARGQGYGQPRRFIFLQI